VTYEEAVQDLIGSLEADTSTDGGESYTLIGNVNVETLDILGIAYKREKAN
jgi:hypothetical protein